jgi:WD40 repeat protein
MSGPRLALVLMLLLSVGPAPAAAPPLRCDRDGDPLPPGAVARIGTVRWRHPGIAALAFGPRGKTLVSVGSGELRVWDMASGRVLRRLRTGPDNTLSAALSRDGKVVAVADARRTILLFDMHTGRLLRRLQAPWGPIASLAFSPDGKFLAARPWLDSAVGLWGVATGKSFPGFGDPGGSTDRVLFPNLELARSHSLGFAPDGRHLAALTERGLVRVGDAFRGRVVWRDRGRSNSPFLAVSPNGRLLAWEGCNEICLADAATGKMVRRLRSLKGSLRPLAFSADGKMLAASEASWMISLWEVASGKCVRRLLVRFKDCSLGAFSADGSALAVADESRIRVWDLASGKERSVVGGSLGPLWSVAVSPDGRTLATSHDTEEELWLWESTGKPLRRLEASAAGPSRLAFAPRGGTLVDLPLMSTDIVVWDWGSGKRRAVLKVPGPDLAALTFAIDGNTLVHVRADGETTTWDLAAPRLLRRAPELEGDRLPDLALLAADARTLILCSEATVQVRDVWTSRRRPSFTSSRGRIECAALSPDGKTVALLTGADSSCCITLVEVATAQQRGRHTVAGNISQLAFTPDSRLLALAVGSTVRLLESASGKEEARLSGHQALVSSLAFTPDGTALVSASRDTTALVWDLRRFRPAGSARLSAQQLQSLWANLGAADARRAYRASAALAEAGAVDFLAARLRRTARDLERRQKRLAGLLADLDSDRYEVRERASRQLAAAGDLAEPILQRALTGKLSPEARQRARRLLAKRNGAAPSAETLRVLRAVEALERLGGPQAREALKQLARGRPDNPVTHEARAAEQRLARRWAVDRGP